MLESLTTKVGWSDICSSLCSSLSLLCHLALLLLNVDPLVVDTVLFVAHTDLLILCSQGRGTRRYSMNFININCIPAVNNAPIIIPLVNSSINQITSISNSRLLLLYMVFPLLELLPHHPP